VPIMCLILVFSLISGLPHNPKLVSRLHWTT